MMDTGDTKLLNEEASSAFERAVNWLDQHGGQWAVRASRASVTVAVAVRNHSIVVKARTLRPEHVRAAVVNAVQWHRGLLRPRKATPQPVEHANTRSRLAPPRIPTRPPAIRRIRPAVSLRRSA